VPKVVIYMNGLFIAKLGGHMMSLRQPDNIQSYWGIIRGFIRDRTRKYIANIMISKTLVIIGSIPTPQKRKQRKRLKALMETIKWI